jgi:hypothetical protein
MKLLVIAGPYEADRLRRAAVSAGFETVAVEPGESLSGWIAGSRPDLIVMAPQIVNPNPSVAVGKVRTASRGKVPIFLVGDAGDEARLRPLADGFFVRPVSPEDLAAQANARVASGSPGAAPPAREPSAPPPRAKPTLGPPNLKPLMAQQAQRAQQAPAGAARARQRETADERQRKTADERQREIADNRLADAFSDLSRSIDDTLDAELRDVFRSVGPMRRSGTPVGPPRSSPQSGRSFGTPVGPPRISPHTGRPMAADLERTRMVPPADAAADQAADEAINELRDESSQKTVEVPRHVVAAMIGPGSGAGGTGTHGQPVAETGGSPPGAMAPVESGQVGKRDVAAMLGRIFLERLTGWLTFRDSDAEKAVVFDNGTPVLAGSNQPEDRMGEMLVRQGRLSIEQQSRSAEMLVSTGRRLGVVLVEMGLIKEGELGPLVRRHYQEIIYSLFAWEAGEWTLGPDRPEKEETVFLTEPAPALILEGIRRKYSASRLLARLGGGGRVLRLRSGGSGASELLDQMRLTDEERALLPLYDGVRTLAEMARQAPVPQQAVWALGWALMVLNQLEPVAETRAGDGTAADSAESAPESPDVGLDRARIMARFALVQDGDYFQILGVSRDAGAYEIRHAHQTLVREFGAAAVAPAIAGELGDELLAIRTVLDEGLRVLGNVDLRRRYQRHLTSPSSGAPTASASSVAAD